MSESAERRHVDNHAPEGEGTERRADEPVADGSLAAQVQALEDERDALRKQNGDLLILVEMGGEEIHRLTDMLRELGVEPHG